MTLTAAPETQASTTLVTHSVTRQLTWLAGSVVVLIVLGCASIMLGSRVTDAADVISALNGSLDTISEAAVAARLPRTVLAALVGAALALSGAAMQGVTRNPLADPGILGVSSGASLAVVLSIVMVGVSHPYVTMLIATLGAAVAAIFVYAVGSIGHGGATPLRLTLAGAATSAACVSLVSALILPRVDLVRSFQFWQIGGVGGATWDRILIASPLLLLGAVITVAAARGMNVLALGDELATGLGSSVTRSRILAASGAVILCGIATALAGPIGFVGLVVPHAARLLVGLDHRWLLPISATLGAGLLITADVLGRIVARPEEVPVGIITAIVGAPVFIWIVRRQKVREL
ncbi:MAG: FecCD family ABC transporter permease [Leucobacter sp.]